jgi:hypothetical protein
MGDFITPVKPRPVGRTPIWAADNGAFTGFDESAFLYMLDAFTEAATPPVFVTMPDVVADHDQTLRLFGRWHRELAWRGLPRAFVLQDGAEKHDDWKCIPWDYIEAVFIGGSTEFKLGQFAAYLVSYAKHMKKWVHMGRVNSIKRLRYAKAIGCDSCDGSGMSRFGNATMLPMINELRQLDLF